MKILKNVTKFATNVLSSFLKQEDEFGVEERHDYDTTSGVGFGIYTTNDTWVSVNMDKIIPIDQEWNDVFE
jgi:hypothetical protein